MANTHNDRRGLVVVYPNPTDYPDSHEVVTREAIARQLACLKDYAFGGAYDPAREYATPLFFVPGQTLVAEQARQLGIRTPDDLFGGVVPYRFVGTKALTHPLVDDNAAAPDGWSHEFAGRAALSVLFGFSAFSAGDARTAAARVLERGAARVKRVAAIGGRGQSVIHTIEELESVLDRIDPLELRTHGIVVEVNCPRNLTFSVGQISVAGTTATYCGTQRLTTDNRGEQVYGGSHLLVVRGGFEALVTQLQEPDARAAVELAALYDRAAHQTFPDLLISRRNYDVIDGTDEHGQRAAGVLEQSWRIGGASGAELAAVRAFLRDPSLRAVRASSVEVYGDEVELPQEATLFFQGVDAHVGRITKYACVEPHAHA